MQRWSGARRVAAAGIAVALGLGAAREAEACLRLCPAESPTVGLAEADAVFQGKVVAVVDPALDDHPSIRRAIRGVLPDALSERLLDGSTSHVFEVQASWKGVQSTRLTLELDGGYFHEGETYLVYADASEEGLVPRQCGRTAHLSLASADLAALGPAPIALRAPPSQWGLFAAAGGAAPLLLGLSLLARRRVSRR